MVSLKIFLISSKKENIAFSPYGLVSVALVLYEGSTGPSAAEIHNSLRLPWDREVTRVGFRDMHRYLKSYFSNDGFLRGLVLSKPNIGLRTNYTDLLQFYGFDIRTSAPKVPTTPTPPVLTTEKPQTPSTMPNTSKPTTTPKPTTITNVPERTTTSTSPETTLFTVSSRFGTTTTTELPKQQTTLLTTLKDVEETTLPPQTRPPMSRTTLERSTMTTTLHPTTKPPTTASPTVTTTKLTITTKPTTAAPTTTIPTTRLPTTQASTTTTAKATTTVAPTTIPPPPTTTEPPQTTTTMLKPVTTAPAAASTTTAPATTKAVDSTQSGTTLDIVTMTDKKPNTPEMMSQVNISALTTTVEPKVMEGREGDSDMEENTTIKPKTTMVSSTIADTTTPTAAKLPGTTDGMTTATTNSPVSQEMTTPGASNSVEVSVAETTVSKSVTMVNPNTTPMPPSERRITGNEDSTTSEVGGDTTPMQSGNPPVTLVIEATSAPAATSADMDSTAMASESMIDQATTIQQAETITEGPTENQSSPTTSIPSENQSSPTDSNPTVVMDAPSTPVTPQNSSTTGDVTVTTEGVTTQVPTATPVPTTAAELLTTIPTTTPQLTTAAEPLTTLPITTPQLTTPAEALASLAPQETTLPSLTTLLTTAAPELIDSAASENRIAAALARQQRSLYSTHKTPDRHQSGSNWVPQYYDQRWGHNPSNEFWFFTYTGGENVPAHTYTAYLPFAFVPELSSLALQLPLDDPRYSILILLPEERYGLSQLLYSLQWCPVRAIITHLKMTAVYAVVPAFTIVKHINLVPALAQLGIHSVFDPFRADLSPMTTEPHLFVRTIEQVVTVSLRKYYPSERWFEAAPSEVRQHFVANHPFAYFVLDKETGVTLMAGTIVNPVAHNQ